MNIQDIGGVPRGSMNYFIGFAEYSFNWNDLQKRLTFEITEQNSFFRITKHIK